MSLQVANQLFREGKIQEALLEYRKIDSDSFSYQQAQFNIRLINLRLGVVDFANHATINTFNQPLVSVVMPIFNVAPYLDASIMSVLSQSYKNIELIIVNDNSMDNSINIIEMYNDWDSRVKIVHLKTNTMGGAGIPSNIGLEYAAGHYLAYIDGDDILDKYAIQKMVESALKHKTDIVIADFRSFHNETRIFKHSYDKKNWVGIPLDEPFSPKDYPKIFRLSPVPWRKLYKISFLNYNNIRFPEGDYFYEDNVLHWFVLTQAKTIVLLDYVVAYHRNEREGQTTSAISLKLLAHFCHLNTIKNHLLNTQNTPIAYWRELVDFTYRVGWVVDRQANSDFWSIAKKRYAQTMLEIEKKSSLSKDEILRIRPNFYKRYKDYNESYDNLELSIIVSVGHCAHILPKIVSSLLKINLRKNIFLIGNVSDNNSWQICQRYANMYKNIHCVFQKDKSSGSVRNLVIPLLTGSYAYFINTNIFVDSKKIEYLVKFAVSNKYDLVFFKNQGKTNENKYIQSSDDIWKNISDCYNNKDRKILASQLNCCFWNRIIKVSKLHDENIFFGNTISYDDIPYHWHTIVSAEHIGFFDKRVYFYQESEKCQYNGISGDYYAMVSEIYRYTHSLLKRYSDYTVIFDYWYRFVCDLLTRTRNIKNDNQFYKVCYKHIFLESNEISARRVL